MAKPELEIKVKVENMELFKQLYAFAFGLYDEKYGTGIKDAETEKHFKIDLMIYCRENPVTD